MDNGNWCFFVRPIQHPAGAANLGDFMFSEYRDQITHLKADDTHFANIFAKHDELDTKIKRMESHVEPGTPLEIEQLKKEKLHLKDEVYAILIKAKQA
jgi:uncharacterized protein YdcH (DUF465 family)